MSRINVRMPEQLKARVEAAAAAEGLSVNAWLVRAAAAAVGPAQAGAHGAPPRGVAALHGLGALAGDRPSDHRRKDCHADVRHTRTHLRQPRARRRRHPHRRERPHRHGRRGAAERPAKKGDVTAAEQTRVEFADGRLSSRRRRAGASTLVGRRRVDRRRDRVAGRLAGRGEAGVAALRSTGRLGELPLQDRASATIRVDETGPSQLRTGAGDVTVERAAGRAEVTTGSGALRSAASTGRRWSRTPTATPGSATSPATFAPTPPTARSPSTGRGRPSPPRPPTATSGSARSPHGEVVAETGFGNVEIGVADGVAAWLDLHTSFGAVHNELEAADRPEPGEDAVEIRARTGYGDITIRRSAGTEHAGRGHDATATRTRRREGHGPAQGLRRRRSSSTASTSRSPRARSSRCSARTARARRRPSRSCPPCSRRRRRVRGRRPRRRARARTRCAAAIGVTGQFSAVDGLLTGEENLRLMADLHHLDRRTGRRR